jgi:hypothetical protein
LSSFRVRFQLEFDLARVRFSSSSIWFKIVSNQTQTPTSLIEFDSFVALDATEECLPFCYFLSSSYIWFLKMQWTPPNVSVPLLNLVDKIFQLNRRGWLRYVLLVQIFYKFDFFLLATVPLLNISHPYTMLPPWYHVQKKVLFER